MAHYRKYSLGDSCLCWSLGSDIDPQISKRILRAYRIAKENVQNIPGFRDLVPSYTALALHFDPLTFTQKIIEDTIDKTLQYMFNDDGFPDDDLDYASLIRLKVVYDGADLERVASLSGLSVKEVVERHKMPCYTVAMMGFIPHFPYLLGLDKHLETPRLSVPRTRVPAGSVAIGGAQTGVYPTESPGGWNLIGRTDPGPLADLEPGDRVVFYVDTDL